MLELLPMLDDPSPDVRIAVAETLARYGSDTDLSRALEVLKSHADWSQHDVFTVLAALNAIDALGAKAEPILDAEVACDFPDHGPTTLIPRHSEYVPRLLEELRERQAGQVTIDRGLNRSFRNTNRRLINTN